VGAELSKPHDLSERVAELTAEDGYRALFDALRERLEAGGQPGAVTLRGLDEQARRAMADILGRRRPPAKSARIRISDIDEGLHQSRVHAGLVEVLEAIGGPLVDRRAERARTRSSWDEVWEEAHEHSAAQGEDVAQWLSALRRTGVLRRLAGEPAPAAALLDRALAVVERLPERGAALSVLAAEATGDPHALDHGEPLATLVLGAAAHIVQAPAVPPSARGRRRLWAQVGVACDPLSVSVLVLGLRFDSPDIMAAACADHASSGEPLRLTLRQLTMAESLPPLHSRVLVCENPAVVASAAVALDGHAPAQPLVCVDGIPDVAADRLFSVLAAGGCSLAFHADFDWGGIRIGNLLAARYGAVPWRFGRADYAAAAERAQRLRPLEGAGGAATWDAELAPTMRATGKRVAEEHVIDDLLADVI
jgi:uncharacterized protein (TIGR02679 family)